MAIVWFYSIASVAIISLASLVGILTLALGKEKTEKVLLVLVSFACADF